MTPFANYIQEYYRTHLPSRRVKIFNLGIGGDTVAIRDGILYLNGEKLDESALISGDRPALHQKGVIS